MAIGTPTQVFASGSTGNLSVYDTQVATLQVGRKYYLQIVGYRTAANNISSVVHDPAGTPLNFTLVTDGTTSARRTAWDTAGHRTEEVWEVVPNSTTASALIRITWAAGQSSCGWRLVEVPSGFDTSGTTVQVVTGQGTTTAVALTMAAFGATANMLLLFVGWGSGTGNPTQTIAPTEGRTELGENNDGERSSLGCHYQNPNGGDTSVGATLSGTTDWGAIGIEMKAGAPTTPETLAATGIAAATIGRVATHLRTLASVEVSLLTMGRVATHFRTLAATGIAGPTLTKRLFAVLAATGTAVTTLVGALAFGVTMAATGVANAAVTARLTIAQAASAVGTAVASLATQFIAGGGEGGGKRILPVVMQLARPIFRRLIR